MEQNAVEQAIQAVGGPTKASYVCRVSVGAIWKWRQQGRVSDGRAAVLLSQASGVPVEALVGLEVVSGNGDEPPAGRRFQKPPKITATYQAPSPGLPVVPRFPDTAAAA
jgi:hypothetical protein